MSPGGGPPDIPELPADQARKSLSVRVGIIGAGAAAGLHLAALQRLRGVRVVAIRDTDPARAAALAARFGLASSIAEAGRFYAAHPQSVHIAAPPSVHEELAMEALRHGAHVLLEKPPAMTVDGCAALLRSAVVATRKIGVNENTAADPLVGSARAVIESGRLGRLLHIDGFYSFGLQAGLRPPAWMRQLPGGMLEDLLPHLLATARALAGMSLIPQHWCQRRVFDIGDDQHDELRLLLTAGSDLTVNLALSLAVQPPSFSFAARGSDGTLTVDLRNRLIQVSTRTFGSGAIATGAELVRHACGMLVQTGCNAIGLVTRRRERFGSFLPLIRAHYDALLEGTPLPAPLEQAMEWVGILRAVWPIG